MIHEFLHISNLTLFFYFLTSNLIYLLLLVVALGANQRHQRRLAQLRLQRVRSSPFAPPVSILVPARNEEQNLAGAVRSLLALDYPALEVIVINDGSTDRTLERLIEEFSLLETDLVYVPEVPTHPLRRSYMSQKDLRLLVLDKEWGGKADSINAGINAGSSPYVCVVDADAVLERDALLRIMEPVLSDPRRVVAAGGIVRVANGSRIEGGELREVRLPRHAVEILQVIEYLRSFLIGREGWAHFNLLLIISGAFGVFRRDLVKRVGGYRQTSIGEDLDLVTRLHRHLQERNVPYHISFVPDPVCWTEVPQDLRSLARQRARWQKGLLDVLWKNRDMTFNPRYGRIGWLAIPYHWVFELFGPLLEMTGYATILTSALIGALDRTFFVQFLLFGYAFATLLSIGAVLQEEVTYRRYNHWRDVARLISYCFLEHFPYRQFQMTWRLWGMWQYLRRDLAWGNLKRLGFRALPDAK